MAKPVSDPDLLSLAARASSCAPSGETWPNSAENCREFAIRIARDGTWFYHGSPIGRKPLVRLFSTVLQRTPDGSYWLVTPAERGLIEVEDAPFTAVALEARGAGREQELVFRTNVDDEVAAGPDHPIRVADHEGEPRPYVMVRDGLEALILRPVFYQLVDLAEERTEAGKTVMGIWSGGAFFTLGARGDA
ncbi:MAG: DUF1285 domain-containing protein [Alphaproteobacteria bacterium]|nr:DUF1285 domain-containing protein [Alphaproteobacteria bacterium]